MLSYRKGKLKEVQRIMADEGGGRGSADIHISPDGRFLYTSHRLKKDGIAIFAIDPEKGTLSKIGYQHTGIHPRNFAITPNGKYLLVACRDDNKIQVFERNEATGELIETPEEIEIDKTYLYCVWKIQLKTLLLSHKIINSQLFIIMTDLEIAQKAQMLPIREVAKKLNISEDDLDPYGNTKLNCRCISSMLRR